MCVECVCGVLLLFVEVLHVHEVLVAHALRVAELVVGQGNVGLRARVAVRATAVAAVVLTRDEIERHTALVARLLVLEGGRTTHRAHKSTGHREETREGGREREGRGREEPRVKEGTGVGE